MTILFSQQQSQVQPGTPSKASFLQLQCPQAPYSCFSLVVFNVHRARSLLPVPQDVTGEIAFVSLFARFFSSSGPPLFFQNPGPLPCFLTFERGRFFFSSIKAMAPPVHTNGDSHLPIFSKPVKTRRSRTFRTETFPLFHLDSEHKPPQFFFLFFHPSVFGGCRPFKNCFFQFLLGFNLRIFFFSYKSKPLSFLLLVSRPPIFSPSFRPVFGVPPPCNGLPRPPFFPSFFPLFRCSKVFPPIPPYIKHFSFASPGSKSLSPPLFFFFGF